MSRVMPQRFNLLAVLGPTASGKTRLAVALAREYAGEIISADSRQVFRRMDIGTGKDLQEYGAVRHHLIDILEPGEEFSVYAFQRLFLQAFEEVHSRGGLPVLCGGTGLYLDAALRGYHLVEVPEDQGLREELSGMGDDALAALLRQLAPSQHNTSDLSDRNRTIRAIEIARYGLQHREEPPPYPDIRPLVLGIRWERAELKRRITARLKARLAEGMLDEVRDLHESGVSWERLDYYGLEYRFAGQYLQGRINRNDLFQKLNAAIHDFAKRQETWFRRMEKNGVVIHWIDGAGDVLAAARQVLRDTGVTS